MDRRLNKITKIFIITMAVLFLSTIFLEFFKTYTIVGNIITIFNILKIALNCLFVVYVSVYLNKNSKIVNIVIVVSNLIADIFLLYTTETCKIIAMIFFCIVSFGYQYILMINNENKKVVVLENVLRIVIQIVVQVIILLLLKTNWSILLCLVGVYGVNLLCNTVFAFLNFKQNKLLAIGLLFFVLCDMFVGLSVGVDMGILTIHDGSFMKTILDSPVSDCWIYYSISQPLLGLSFIKN